MNFNVLLPLIATLACPVGMGVMMWFMNRRTDPSPRSKFDSKSAAEQLSVLYQQRQLMEAQIAELTQLAELDTHHETLLLEKQNPVPSK